MRAGASPISPMIARRVLSKYRFDQVNKENKPIAPVEYAQAAINFIATEDSKAPTKPGFLSPREQEVLALIARGFSYTEIARLQGLSVHTIQTHIKNLYAKLSVHSKSEAVFEATRMGLLSQHD
jgi:DNA-binding NarL/FixJ family response regulator